jgi:DNA-binding transcriptional ArsR family regulator
MTIRIQLSGADVARVRFGLSAVAETIRSLRVLAEPGTSAIHLPWVRWAGGRLPDDPDVALLRRLLGGRSVPLALLPTPDTRLPELRHELRRVRQASPARTIESLENIFGHPRWLDAFYDDPPAVLGRLAGAIERCYDAVVAPHWPRMRAILEADIDFRARRLASAGVERVIRELHPDIRWTDGEVQLRPNQPNKTGVVETTGAGLVLSPMVFGWPAPTSSLRPTGPACIRYPARGIGTLWELPVERPGAALCDLLGTTRAGILIALADPADTPTLARRLDVTSGAVSQHLRVLRDAGLVRTARDGRTALHLRTKRADILLDAGPTDTD